MYIPAHFEESSIEILHEFMQAYPFATLVTLSSTGLNANHLPLLLQQKPGQYGVLQGHIARANPLKQDIVEGGEVLVIFQGPNSYISPSWYATKQEHGKVVPTWNYTVVHAYGNLQLINDATWLRSHLEAVTTQHEASFNEPWSLNDAPQAFTDRLLEAIMGIEITITKLSGKWKVSQNQPLANQAGVIKGLQERGDSQALAMAALVKQYGGI